MSKLLVAPIYEDREKLQKVKDDKESARTLVMAEITDIEQRLTSPSISNERRTALTTAKMRAEGRLTTLNAHIKGINRKIDRLAKKESKTRKKARLERHMRRMQLLQGEYQVCPSDPSSLLHALWRITKAICKRNMVFPDDKEILLVDQIEEFLVEHCRITENGQVLPPKTP